MAPNPDSDKTPEEPQDALTEIELQERLKAYQKAIKAEYEQDLESAPEQAAEITRDYFRNNMAMAAAQVVHLAENAESESIKFAANKYIIDCGMKESAREHDPIKEIIAGLEKKSGKSKTSS